MVRIADRSIASTFSKVGRPKITSADAVAIREARHQEQPVSYTELAEKYGLAVKTVKRICFGQSRKNAGGPIETPVIVRNGELPFDVTQTIRCPTCGGLVHPPCFLCHRAGRKRRIGSG